MRKLVLFAAVLCLISCYGGSAFGEGRYMGLTAGALSGGGHGGLAGRNQSCVNNFGVTAHMCTTTEFFATAGVPGAVGTTAWVQPALHDCIAYSSSTDPTGVFCVEGGSSALVAATNLAYDCAGWSDSTESGTAAYYTSTAGWTLVVPATCSNSYRIACCQYQ